MAIQPLDDYQLHLTVEDGVEGIIDVTKLIEFTGIFESLIDPNYFNQVIANKEISRICWPNDADLDSDVLYSLVSDIKHPLYRLSSYSRSSWDQSPPQSLPNQSLGTRKHCPSFRLQLYSLSSQWIDRRNILC